MKLYECYEDEYTTYYIAAHNEEEATTVLRRELITEGGHADDVNNFSIDELTMTHPRIVAISTNMASQDGY